MRVLSNNFFFRSFTVLTVLVSLSNCANSPSQPNDTPISEGIEKNRDPKETIEDLVVWLEKHPDQADERSCFELDGVDAFAIDTVCLDNYIATLKNTGLFSKSYLEGLRIEFIAIGSEIKSEGYAPTKDYDRYVNSQDPPSSETVLNLIKKTAVTMDGENKAMLKLTFDPEYSLTYQLVKEADGWKVSLIE